MNNASKIKVAIASIFLATTASAGAYYLHNNKQVDSVAVTATNTATAPASERVVARAPAPVAEAAPAVAAPAVDAAPAAATPAPAAAGSLLPEITLQQASDLNALAKQYPFLSDTVKEVQAANADPDSVVPSSIYVATDKDSLSGTEFLIVKVEGNLFCGSAGCLVMIYPNTGSGFNAAPYRALGDVAFYRNQTANAYSILTCTDGDQGRTELTFKNGTFNASPLSSLPQASTPACVPPFNYTEQPQPGAPKP